MSVRFIRNKKHDATEEELATMTDDRYNTRHSHYNNYTYYHVTDFNVETGVDSFDAVTHLGLLD